MWWKKKPEPPLRDQLMEACAKVRRQIEILEHPSGVKAPGDTHSVRAELQSELARLEQALAELDHA